MRLVPDWAPPRSTVYEWFRRLADGGWLEMIHHALLMAVRELQGREASPTLGIIDSQSVKVMAPAGPRGYDAAKKINGRKRHILVDRAIPTFTEPVELVQRRAFSFVWFRLNRKRSSRGNLLAARVTDAAVQDRDGGLALLCRVRSLFPWLLLAIADSAYTGRFEMALGGLRITVQIVRRPDFAKGFVLL